MGLDPGSPQEVGILGSIFVWNFMGLEHSSVIESQTCDQKVVGLVRVGVGGGGYENLLLLS